MRPVKMTKLTATDAFVVVDLPDAASATGVVRCARKILPDGATNLARAVTYAYASFGIARSGASAGINAEGEGRDAAVAAFVDEVAPQVADGSLTLTPGKGVSLADLAAWGDRAPAAPDHAALAAGVVAAAAAVGAVDGAVALVEENAPAAAEIVAALTAAGATADAVALDALLTSAPAIAVVGSKMGVLDHENVAALGAATVLGAAPLAITARGLAVATRQGATVPADFVTSAGALLAAAGTDDVGAAIGDAVAATLDHAEGPFLGACERAEEFLRTWTDELPFGRPLA